MSTTRRKSYNNIKQTASSSSKSLRKSSSSKHPKRYSTTHRYSIQNIQHSKPHRNSYHHTGNNGTVYNGGYNGYNHNNNNNINNEIDDNLPNKPTHKKNAVSSFLSIFSGFSQSKVRRQNSNQSDIMENSTDLELLKRMKRRILDIISKICGMDNI